MKFGPVSLVDSEGGKLAHSLNLGGLRAKNGAGKAVAGSAEKQRVA